MVSGILYCVDTRSSRILANHAAFISLAHNMQLFFFNSRFGPACFGQGKRRAARHISPFSPLHLAASILGLRTISRLLLTLRHVPCNPIICIACSLPGNRRARSGFLAYSSSISGGHNHPVSQWIYSCLSLRSSYLVGSKWSFLHNVEFSDPTGFHSLPVIRKQTLCNHFSLSISSGLYGLFIMAGLNRFQP